LRLRFAVSSLRFRSRSFSPRFVLLKNVISRSSVSNYRLTGNAIVCDPLSFMQRKKNKKPVLCITRVRVIIRYYFGLSDRSATPGKGSIHGRTEQEFH
jgi:hypothetical protein